VKKIPDQSGFLIKYRGPIEIMYWIGLFIIPLLAWFIPLSPANRNYLIYLTVFSAILSLCLFHWLLPRYGSRRWVIFLGAIGPTCMIAYGTFLLRPYNMPVEILFLVVIMAVGVLAGQKLSLWTVALTILAEILITALQPMPSLSTWLALGVQIVLLLLAGLSVSYFTGVIHEQAQRTDKRNRYLSTLLQTGILASRTEDLSSTLKRIAELITRAVPVTYCRICLLDTQNERLVTYGAHPIRRLDRWEQGTGECHPLATLPTIQQTLESGKTRVLTINAPGELTDEEKEGLFIDNVKTICLLPLATKEKTLGLISVGEARSQEREPFTQEKLELLQTLATQISAAIYNQQLFQETEQKAKRLSVLNEVGKAIGSTIELDDLLELVYEQLSKMIPTDTYYVALYEAQENILDLRILIDDDQRFPSERIRMGKGFASWVVQNRRPLLINHLTVERESLPVKGIQLGQNKLSESWLGVPILVGDNILGMLAIASYTPHAFKEEDVNLLINVAAQAALALDNARQHAEVKEQARRDSLTGVYNHGHFLNRLEEEVELGRASGTSVSLIMLDVDYFKPYNDLYGHVNGDEVLRQMVKAIQSHVKKTDITGRWGGEEFAVALPGASTDEAIEVAQRIRKTLAELELKDNKGRPIASPTVSQGIATFPQHARDASRLVDVADLALYKAKERGRDSVVCFQ
jgi:diguanylate cyclase (GGDEF)-like protein